MGSTIKNLPLIQSGNPMVSVLYATLVSTIASVAVVIAFARKAAAQSFVSIEDFWGGTSPLRRLPLRLSQPSWRASLLGKQQLQNGPAQSAE
jgi:hypothetical protein